jgi:endonuclease I
MSTTYNMPIDPNQEKTLRSWNAAYPVTDTERDRAQKIFQYQGNRNPFIENPEWVSLISDF